MADGLLSGQGPGLGVLFTLVRTSFASRTPLSLIRIVNTLSHGLGSRPWAVARFALILPLGGGRLPPSPADAERRKSGYFKMINLFSKNAPTVLIF